MTDLKTPLEAQYILITGDRGFPQRGRQVIEKIIKTWSNAGYIILHGACPSGADAYADSLCAELKVPQKKCPADWKLGKKAGPLRNAYMVSLKPTAVYAFHDDLKSSKGTLGCVNLALKNNIPVFLYSSLGYGDRYCGCAS